MQSTWYIIEQAINIHASNEITPSCPLSFPFRRFITGLQIGGTLIKCRDDPS